MSKSRRTVILVPDCSGGIDRLFERLPAIWRSEESDFSIAMFKTHGRSLFGIKVLPFKLVYYSSAVFYMIVFFPVRILKFIALCLFRRIDICHINLSTGASTFRKIIFAFLCRLFGVQYVIHLHGGKYPGFYARVSSPYRKIIKSFFERAGCVIVLGEIWKKFVVQEIGIDANKVTILPNAVSGPARFSQLEKTEPVQILFLGRLFEPKAVMVKLPAIVNASVTSACHQESALQAGSTPMASLICYPGPASSYCLLTPRICHLACSRRWRSACVRSSLP